MSDNYAVINGKRVELTDTQLKALGIKERKNPFERAAKGEPYCYIDAFDRIQTFVDNREDADNTSFEASNYFNDKTTAQQVRLHQLLYRKLLKFAYDNGCEDTAEWNGVNKHWLIGWSCDTGDFIIFNEYDYKGQEVYFSSKEVAERAIKDVVEPFMKDHPEFIW